MDDYNQLLLLQKNIKRKEKVEKVLVDLYLKQENLKTKLSQSHESYLKEHKEYIDISSNNLKSYLYRIIGKLDEKMDKEEQEAILAKTRYDFDLEQLKSLESSIKSYEYELNDIQNCSIEYDRLFTKRVEQFIKEKGSLGIQIVQLQEQIGYLKAQRKEAMEAFEVGKKSLQHLNQILKLLQSAKEWGTVDLVGGGMVFDLMKHSDLEQAEEELMNLQQLLNNYKNELVDVKLEDSLTIRLDDFLSVADLLFDGLFADWAVLDQINHSYNQMEELKNKIESTQSNLNESILHWNILMNQLQNNLDEIILVQ